VILPPWWSTTWFRISAISIILGSLLNFYRIRMKALAREFHANLEGRVEERTRVARELHDTLLQSFQGLTLRFQSVVNLLPARPEEAKQRLEKAIDHAAQAVTDGRKAIQEMRTSTVQANDLARAISTLGDELAAGESNQNSAVFRAQVEGKPRDLHPILRDEIYRIAGEALRNAFRHAQARRIEVLIHYDDRRFLVHIRDDGKGIDQKVVNEGRAGHFGLPGMRERAKLIGGTVEVWSEVDSGTEVELSVPASVAYASARRRSRLFARRTGTKS